MKFVDGVTVPVCSYSDRTLSVINVNFYFDIWSLHGRQAVSSAGAGAGAVGNGLTIL